MLLNKKILDKRSESKGGSYINKSFKYFALQIS